MSCDENYDHLYTKYQSTKASLDNQAKKVQSLKDQNESLKGLLRELQRWFLNSAASQAQLANQTSGSLHEAAKEHVANYHSIAARIQQVLNDDTKETP